MRFRTVILAAVAIAALSVPSAVFAARTGRHYSGGAGPSDHYKMSFVLSRGYVKRFTFQSRCPGLAKGVTVPARIRVRHGRFHYHDAQFTIAGRFVRGGMARGTERDVTGDCDSGTLHWSARRG